ncbi:MAG: hypothetical protein AAF787_17525 [Chloroflexota bacterium]
MLRLILRPLLLLITVLALCVGVIRVGYGLAYPMEASLFSHPDCDDPCVLGIQPGLTTETELEEILDGSDIPYLKVYASGFDEDPDATLFEWSERIVYIRHDSFVGGEEIVWYVVLVESTFCNLDTVFALGSPDYIKVEVDRTEGYLMYENIDMELLLVGADVVAFGDHMATLVMSARRRAIDNRRLKAEWRDTTAANLLNHCRE